MRQRWFSGARPARLPGARRAVGLGLRWCGALLVAMGAPPLAGAQARPESSTLPRRAPLAQAHDGAGQRADGRADPFAAAPSGLDPTAHLLDYSLMGAALLTLGVSRAFDPAPAAFGPRYDPGNPAAILDPRLSDRIGGEMERQRVPTTTMGLVVAGGWLASTAVASLGQPGGGVVDTVGLHHGAVGFAESLLLTVAVVEVTKKAAGRLRPDFQDRARSYHCSTDAGAARLSAEHCVGVTPGGAELVEDGRKSFMSGHAATAFATAGHLSLQLGGRWVWGARATPASRALGLLGQAALLGGASWVAWGRVEENRHHALDVAVGAAVGLGLAQLGYWRFYDTDGRPRATTEGPGVPSLEVGPSGLGLGGRF